VIVVQHLDQAADLVWLHGRLFQPADVAHVAGGAQQGQLVPAGKGRVVALRDRQTVVEGPVQRALAEGRRDQLVDDPVVEGVTGHPDPGMAERGRTQGAVGLALEADERKVAGAAAEVGDQHGGVLFQLAGKEEGRADRLIGIADLAETQPGEGGLIALQGQGFVGIAAGKGHRPPDHDARRQA